MSYLRCGLVYWECLFWKRDIKKLYKVVLDFRRVVIRGNKYNFFLWF